MLKALIQKLEQIEYKLMKIKNEGVLAECFLPHECYRSLTSMVNILNSLVNKTIQNKNYEDDIAQWHNRSHNTSNKSSFPNLSNTDEFLNEVVNVLMSKPESIGEVHIYLSNFQDLLGDLVFSICEINNCKMKHASGIKVKDLVLTKNLYSSLWELLSSLFHPNTSNQNKASKTQRKQTKEKLSEMNMLVSDLVNDLESCFREMSKIKLQIEHYIKFNLIEMQFDKQEGETTLKSNVSEENIKKSQTGQYFNSQDNDINRQDNSEVFCQKIPEHGNDPLSTSHNMMPPTASVSHENYLGSPLFPQTMGGWDNCYDYKFVQNPYGNIFNGPIIYPPDVLFFEPPTVVFQSQLEPARKHSLPKIYSLDSMNDDNPTKPSREDNVFSEDKELENVVLQVHCSDKKENVIKELLFEDVDDDLFSESLNSKRSEAKYVQLKEKISSLFNMFKTNQTGDIDDIFDMNPLKIEEGNSTSFQKPKNNKLEPKTKIKKKKYVKGKHLNRNMTSQLQNGDTEKAEVIRNKFKKSFIQNALKREKYNSLLNQERLRMEYPMECWAPTENEVIYDRQSIIELFKSNTVEGRFNAESVPTEKSTFCLWPVAAEYIYVSRGDVTENGNSVQSSHSILLDKKCEKSFYTLHMNKKYEQKQLYEGDIIVFDHTETERLQNKRNSSCSVYDQFTVAFDRPEAIGNKHVNPPNCAERNDITKQQRISFKNSLAPTEHGGIKTQQTYAVHYADCADSFITSKDFKNEKIDFFNFNSYDKSHNWDSFISIMTSKVGPNTHINEQRMFRKIVKNLGAETLHNNNLFGNINTLTSSGGPFRLFDINGYPLTDSEGNVLKDPYGKCLVQLDSTGFPKDDIKVFDAAGNSPKDVKFDPTQKPQTNCVVVKLTDNFKRPLHLFDKYGRPLTDSSGKLLVNVHGRPLLRFDNFGRPNTDYRGGPLYTDNGFRWSFKAQSLSNNQISTETLTSQKVENVLSRDKSVCTDMTEEKSNTYSDDCSPIHPKLDNFANVDSRNSDIWLQVENVLQKHSKKTKVEVRLSKTNILINSGTVNANPKEKQYLSSDISPKTGAMESSCYCSKGSKMEQNDHKAKDNKNNVRCNLLLDKIDCGSKNDIFNVKVSLPFHDKTKVESLNSKYFTNTKFKKEHYMPDTLLENHGVLKDPQLLVRENVFRTNRNTDVSLCHPTGTTNILPSIFNFKNQEYLNNLCNKILKHQMASKIILKDINPKPPEMTPEYSGKKDNITDTLSDFTSSFVSKYTNDVPLFTDSTTGSVESYKRDPQIMKILEDIDTKFRKNYKLKNISNEMGDSTDQQEYFASDNNNKGRFAFNKANKKKDHKDHPKEVLKLSGTSEETNTYIDIVNKGIKKYQINVKERMRTGFQSNCDDHFISTDRNCITNDIVYPERENEIIKHNKNIREEQQTSRPIDHTTGVYHGEYCRHFKNEKNKLKDSPFRFPSEQKLETTIAVNSKVDFVDGKNWMVQDQNKTNHKGFIINHKHAAVKHEYLYPDLMKKPRRNGRDCNLVSFFGTPVKYVLNKLDTKLSLRQEAKENKLKHLKTVYEPNKNEAKMKTLYSKVNKKYVASSEANSENKRCHKHGKIRENLMAYKSKSFSEIQGNKVGLMSYSGSQDTSGKYSPESSSQYKCSSDTVVTCSHRHATPQRKSRRYEVKKPKKEQYLFETHYVNKSNTTNHQHQRNDKSPRGYTKQTSKSLKNRAKTTKLFNKTGYTSRQKRSG